MRGVRIEQAPRSDALRRNAGFPTLRVARRSNRLRASRKAENGRAAERQKDVPTQSGGTRSRGVIVVTPVLAATARRGPLLGLAALLLVAGPSFGQTPAPDPAFTSELLDDV